MEKVKTWEAAVACAVIVIVLIALYHAGWLNFLLPGRKRVADKTPLLDEYAPGQGPGAAKS